MAVDRIVGVWLILALAMIANGAFREVALRQAIGPANAQIVSAVLGVVIILAITRWAFRRLAGAGTRPLVIASAVLVGLTVAFEFLFGHYVDRKTWTELVADYAIWRGRLWPIVLLVLALTPFLWGRWAARPEPLRPQRP
jgi:hypothetical protein